MKDNQQCEKMIDTYLMLDKHERIPLAVCVHLLTCKKCRTQVRMMTQAEEKLSSPLAIQLPFSDLKLCSIMQSVDPGFDIKSICPVSMRKWVITGIFMIIGIIIFEILDYLLPGAAILSASIHIVFGISIVLYCTIFIASNLEFFVKLMQTSAKPADKKQN
ncbi:MAG: hypothetical protein J6Y75_04355 [Spirochaetaceae bacterium]|nr:hypothetical protein [Spirochaetaceae bacterium]MBP5329110.1 hypothetical protein [Spirochaetaceae bacterium]